LTGNVPYQSHTQDPDERFKLASVLVVGTNLAILVLVLVVSPRIEGSSDLQRSLTTAETPRLGRLLLRRCDLHQGSCLRGTRT
jgi:hypothetical protein